MTVAYLFIFRLESCRLFSSIEMLCCVFRPVDSIIWIDCLYLKCCFIFSIPNLKRTVYISAYCNWTTTIIIVYLFGCTSTPSVVLFVVDICRDPLSFVTVHFQGRPLIGQLTVSLLGSLCDSEKWKVFSFFLNDTILWIQIQKSSIRYLFDWIIFD